MQVQEKWVVVATDIDGITFEGNSFHDIGSARLEADKLNDGIRRARDSFGSAAALSAACPSHSLHCSYGVQRR